MFSDFRSRQATASVPPQAATLPPKAATNYPMAPASPQAMLSNSEARRIFVGGLNYTVTNEELKMAFSNIGHVQDCNVVPGRGFAFVTFEKPEEVDLAMDTQPHCVSGSKVDIRRYASNMNERNTWTRSPVSFGVAAAAAAGSPPPTPVYVFFVTPRLAASRSNSPFAILFV